MIIPGGRLSLASGVALTIADVASSSAIHLVPALTNETELWDGTGWAPYSFDQVTLELSGAHAANKNFDVFEFDDGGVNIGTGPAWPSDSSRGVAATTELESWHGVAVNKYEIELRNGGDTFTVPARKARHRGGFRTTSAGYTADTYARRFLSNAYNQSPRNMHAILPPSQTWVYSANAWAQAFGDADLCLRYFQCVAGGPVRGHGRTTLVNNTTAGMNVYVGVGVNSVTVNSAFGGFYGMYTGGIAMPLSADYDEFAALGFTTLNLLARGAGSNIQTWLSSVGVNDALQTGIIGEVWG